MREQFLADAGFAQQQHGQVGFGHHVQLMQQVLQRRALADDLGLIARGALGRDDGVATVAAQGAQLVFQPGDAGRGLDRNAQRRQFGLRVDVEGAGLQRIQRDDAPARALYVERQAHAVVHRQRLPGALGQQAVVRVGQMAVVVKARDAVALQDGRQARVVADGEAPPQGLVAQPIDRHGPQVVALQLQHRHRPAMKVRAQAGHQPLHAHGGGQF